MNVQSNFLCHHSRQFVDRMWRERIRRLVMDIMVCSKLDEASKRVLVSNLFGSQLGQARG